MKKIFIISSLLLSLQAFSFSQDKKEEVKPMDENKALYSLGVAISKNVLGYNFTTEQSDKIIKGFSDSLKGIAKEGDYDFALIGPFIEKKQQETAKAEKEKSKEYIAKAEKEKGAKKFDSGLIYKEIKKGKGESPKAEDKVTVHYKGYLTNGKVFDSSYDRKEPATFPLNQVIPCWTEGVQKMKVGTIAKLVCPSNIAYGDMGRPPVIPGGATLVFDVELLKVEKNDVTNKEVKK